MKKEHPHHKMYEKHSKGGHVAHMGDAHWEKKQEDVSVCDCKYTPTEMGNPEALSRSTDALSSYVRKNKMKY